MLKTANPFPSPSTYSTFLKAVPLRPYICTRCLHAPMRKPPVPPPTPFVPNHTTFLKLIGRSLSRFAPKISSWAELFGLSSEELRERGIEPARDRRYLLRWRQKYRNGEFGIGGDMRFVSADGVAWMRVVELPRLSREDLAAGRDAGGVVKSRSGHVDKKPSSSSSPSPSPSPSPSKKTSAITAAAAQAIHAYLSTNKIILNLPQHETDPSRILDRGQSSQDLKQVQMVKLANGHMIRGPHVQPVKGSNGSVATLKACEGLWEHRRGHKVDGGERRRAEVRFKRGVEERKKVRV